MGQVLENLRARNKTESKDITESGEAIVEDHDSWRDSIVKSTPVRRRFVEKWFPNVEISAREQREYCGYQKPNEINDEISTKSDEYHRNGCSGMLPIFIHASWIGEHRNQFSFEYEINFSNMKFFSGSVWFFSTFCKCGF